MATHRNCGGTIFNGTPGDLNGLYDYCDRCGAFRFAGTDPAFPTGTDASNNRAAWDNEDSRSPDAVCGMEPDGTVTIRHATADGRAWAEVEQVDAANLHYVRITKRYRSGATASETADTMDAADGVARIHVRSQE